MSETTTEVKAVLTAEDRASVIVQKFRSEVDKLQKSMSRLAKVTMPDLGSKLSASPAAREAVAALKVQAQAVQARTSAENRASQQRVANARTEAAQSRMFDAADVARLRDRMAVQGRLSRQRIAEAHSEERQRRTVEAATLRDVQRRMAAFTRMNRQQAAEHRAADRERQRAEAAAERDAASSARRKIGLDNYRFRLRERHDRQERQERLRAEREAIGRGRDALGHSRDAYSRLTRPPAAVAAIAAGASTVATRRILSAEADTDAAEINTRIYGGLDAKAARTLRDQWAAPLAEELGTAPHQLLTGWTDAIKLGMTPKVAKEFTELSAKTSAAWEVPVEIVNDVLGTMNTLLTSNGAAPDPKRLHSVANAIQHLAAKQSTTPERLLEFMKQGAGGAQILGMSLESAAAFGSASTSLGNRPGESGRMLDYLAGRVVELPRLTKQKGDQGKQARALVDALGYGSAEAMDRKRRADPDAFLPDLLERFGKIKDQRQQEESIRFFTGREWLGEFGRMVKGLDTYKEAVALKKEAAKLDAIGEVWNLHRTKLSFVGRQFSAGWLNILGEFGKVLSPMARQAGDSFLGWSAQLRAGGLAARFKASIEGFLDGLGFKDLPDLLRSTLGEPGKGAAGAIESWRAAARGFGQGIRDVGEMLRGAFRMVSGGSGDPEVIGRWTARILGLSAALVIASPAISILGGIASALLAFGSAAVAVSGFVRMLGTVGATSAGLRLVAARLVTVLFGGIGLGIVAEIGARRGEIATMMLGAMKSLWDGMIEGIKGGIAEWRAEGFLRGIARFLDPRLVDDPGRRDERGHYKVEPGAEQSGWRMFWDWLKGQQTPDPVAPPATVQKQSAIQDWRGMVQPAAYVEAERPASPMDPQVLRALERIAEIRAARADRRDDGQDGANLNGLIRPASLDGMTELRRAVDRVTSAVTRSQLASLSSGSAAAVSNFPGSGVGLAGAGGHGGGGLPHPSAVPGWYGGGNGVTAPMLKGEAQANARKSYEFFRAKGLSHEAASGILASMKQESGFNPRARGDGGRAHGLFQHHPDRRAAIQRATGIDMSTATLEQQLEGMWWESNNGDVGARRALAILKRPGISARDAGAAFVQHFERPKADERASRGAMAEGFAREFAPGGKADPSGSAPVAGGVHPLDGAGRVTSDFGMRRHPIHGTMRHHAGVDLAAPAGTIVKAMREGIASLDRSGDVTVRHGDGSSATYRHVTAEIAEGARVATGQAIARLRAHDPRSTGPHLHLETRDQQGRLVDPKAALERAPAATAKTPASVHDVIDSFTPHGWKPGLGGNAAGVPKTMENKVSPDRVKAMLSAPDLASRGLRQDVDGAKALAGAASPPTAGKLADTVPAPSTRLGDAGGTGQGSSSGRAAGSIVIHQTINGAGRHPQEVAGDVQRHITEAWNHRAHDLEPELT